MIGKTRNTQFNKPLDHTYMWKEVKY